METLLYLNGTTESIDPVTSDKQSFFAPQENVYILNYNGTSFKWQGNMWMEY